MDEIFTCILLLLSLSGTFTKYVYVKEEKNWPDAQKYCRQTYTDLAPVSNQNDLDKLQQLSGNVDNRMWIGLERNSSNRTQWLWSGGGAVSWFLWEQGEPNGLNRNEDYGGIRNERWHDFWKGHLCSFFCYSAFVVRENRTWEEALEYCREQHDDLASVASETEILLMQTELKKYNTTEHVWIGLRFLSGDWLWVDGQELDYELWGQGGKPSCPDAKMKCGALQVTGGSLGVWEARDCEKRLNFICY
ncbi:C-type lectin lectoxin-Lio3-like [Archocentrus centrarchus]|uniref:C-type lectin lectoxin-Lio3-like n=1 Tax=Archocentrus centrarchus TaxID=63155 RepID=UPI0011E9CE84|nr:C-type lectin lectoxin-Lio3-like [Archocentrus centrarchus]